MAQRKTEKNGKRKPHLLYLGVDGGGTKTQIAIMNGASEVVCEGFAGPSNPLRVGVETSVNNIMQAIDAACDTAGASRGDIVSATLGLAGVRRQDLRQRVRESFYKHIHIRNIEVVTDAEIALYGTTLGKPGIVIIAGTGSICLGKNAKGEIAVAGGWGPLAGDEGGGSTIARQALAHVARASDGRGQPTKLSERAAEYFRASTPENLIVAIYSPQMDNARIAGFARFVVETALEGDKIAVDIISEGGYELGRAACAVIKKLGLTRHKVPVGCVGSIFKAGEMFTAPMIDTIHRVAPKAFLTTPPREPAHAAALMAFENYKNGDKK